MRDQHTRPEILLVDDDASLVDVLSMALEDAGWAVRTAPDGLAGWEAFERREPDLVILDLLMPEIDGLELCRMIRRERTTPVIMLTSRDHEMDKVLGLDVGADDYVTKPFSTRELTARIRSILRRVQLDDPAGAADAVIERGPCRLDRSRRQVSMDGRQVALTSTEFELLWTLASQPGHVFDRDLLIDRVYGKEVVVAHRTVDTFVKRIRQKLSSPGCPFDGVETIRGVGYRFTE